MKKTLYITFLVLVLAAIWAGFYFKDTLFGVYDHVTKNLPVINTTNLGSVADEIKKEILSPNPLNIGGSANNVVLVKAKIIAQTNFARFDNGSLPPLIENTQLDAAALAKANDIFKNQYFEHVSPSGVDPGALVKKFGYDYIVEGENLILGNFASEQEVVQDWMNSPGHRANILNNRVVDIGVAIIKGTYKGQTVWVGVQEFGLPLSSCISPDTTLKTEIDSDKAQLEQLSVQINAQRDKIDHTSSKDPNYNTMVNEYNVLVNQYNELSQTTKNAIGEYNIQINSFNQCVQGSN